MKFEGCPVFLGYKEPVVSYETVKAYAHSLNLSFGSRRKFNKYISENDWPEHFPRRPDRHFKEEFEDWPEFLGYKGLVKPYQLFVPYETVKAYAHSLNLGFRSGDEFKKYISENHWPEHFPRNPATYFTKEFEGWSEFLEY